MPPLISSGETKGRLWQASLLPLPGWCLGHPPPRLTAKNPEQPGLGVPAFCRAKGRPTCQRRTGTWKTPLLQGFSWQLLLPWCSNPTPCLCSFPSPHAECRSLWLGLAQPGHLHRQQQKACRVRPLAEPSICILPLRPLCAKRGHQTVAAGAASLSLSLPVHVAMRQNTQQIKIRCQPSRGSCQTGECCQIWHSLREGECVSTGLPAKLEPSPGAARQGAPRAWAASCKSGPVPPPAQLMGRGPISGPP